MKFSKKYILSLVAELVLLLFYIIFPKYALILIGARSTQVNILGLLLFFSFHAQMSYLRKEEFENKFKDLKKFHILIEIIRMAIVLFAVYRLQITLGAGI